MRIINPEWGLELKIILMHQKDAFRFRRRICRFHFETDKALGTYFILCDINDVTMY